MDIDKAIYKVAYLTMEVALENRLRNYAGGLGILAGDMMRSAADLSIPMVGVSLLSDKGYFSQEIVAGKQLSGPDHDYDFSRMSKLDKTIKINIGKESVKVGVWEYLVKGRTGFVVPFYFLDTDFPDNSEKNRLIADSLYGGDDNYRLRQEIILGIGGVEILKALGYERISKYHLNEGHSGFAAAHIFVQYLQQGFNEKQAIKCAKNKIVFTNHTPVKAGNDSFSWDLVDLYYGDSCHLLQFSANGRLDMNELSMSLSGFTFGVSKTHMKILRKMYPGKTINYINNGVDSAFWVSSSVSRLLDKYAFGWDGDNCLLAKAKDIPLDLLADAHLENKNALINLVRERTGNNFSNNEIIIGFARRFASYKRPQLIFNDIRRLSCLAEHYPIQLVFAGKAHPRDELGQKIISDILELSKSLHGRLKFVFLEDYDIDLAKKIISGSDVWLNNPLPPLEASGTSGMKAAMNGVPQISTMDGWWIDGYKRGRTGWVFGKKRHNPLYNQSDYDAAIESDADDLYDILEKDILPAFYLEDKKKWLKICRWAISINGKKFSSQLVVRNYARRAYGL